MKPLTRTPVLAILAALVLPVCAQQPEPDTSSARRMRPPPAVSCDRNQLTSYSGVVTEYQRQPGMTRLSIHTDWNTDESIELQHAGSDDPSHRFLLSGQPFAASDWQRIESAPGILNTGMRATAWVCGDNENPTLIDWQPRD